MDNGQEKHITLTARFNTRTGLVTYTCDDMPIALAQMIVDEVSRQLEIQRRQAAALELQKSMLQAAKDDEIRRAMTRGARG